MSNNSINDLKLIFNDDGSVDLDISATGDINTTLGDSIDEEESIRINAIQIIKFLILTPLGSIKNENDSSDTQVGSELWRSIGEPINEMSCMMIQIYVQSALLQATFIAAINSLEIKQDGNSGVISVHIDVSIIHDNLRVVTTIPLNLGAT